MLKTIEKTEVSPKLLTQCGKLIMNYNNLPSKTTKSLYAFVGASDYAKSKPTITEVIHEYCNHIGISFEQLSAKCRKREETIKHRQIIQHFIASRINQYGLNLNGFKTSLQKIGETTGGKNHATVLHSKKTVQGLIETDKAFANYYRGIESYLTNKFGIE